MPAYEWHVPPELERLEPGHLAFDRAGQNTSYMCSRSVQEGAKFLIRSGSGSFGGGISFQESQGDRAGQSAEGLLGCWIIEFEDLPELIAVLDLLLLQLVIGPKQWLEGLHNF